MRTFMGRCLGTGVLVISALTATAGTAGAAPATGGSSCLDLGGISKQLTIDIRAQALAETTYEDAATGFQVQVSHVTWSGPGHNKLRVDFSANAHVEAVLATTNVDVLPSTFHLPAEILGRLSPIGSAWASVDLDVTAWIGLSIDKITFCWKPGPITPPDKGGTTTTTTTASTTTTTQPTASSPTTTPSSTTFAPTGGSPQPPTTTTDMSTTGDLPRTGTTVGPLAALGSALLTTGALALAATHRLRNRPT